MSITALLQDHRAFASPFQMVHFVLEASAAGTWWGFYKQALREMHSRLRSLQLGLIELERAERVLARLDLGEEPDADLDAAKKRIEIDDSRHLLEQTRDQLALLYAYALYARQQLPVTIDEEVRAALERGFWEAELCKQVLADNFSGRPTSPETWEHVMVLPPDVALKLQRAIVSQDCALSDFKLRVPELAPAQVPTLLEIAAMAKELAPCST